MGSCSRGAQDPLIEHQRAGRASQLQSFGCSVLMPAFVPVQTARIRAETDVMACWPCRFLRVEPRRFLQQVRRIRDLFSASGAENMRAVATRSTTLTTFWCAACS